MEENISPMPLWKWCLFMFIGVVVLLVAYAFAQTPLFMAWPLWESVVYLLVGACVIAGLYRYFERLYRKCNTQPVGRILSRKGILSDTAEGLVIGFVYFVLVVALMMLIGVYSIKSWQFNGTQLLIWFFGYLVVAVGEECVFRGIMFRLIDERWGFWVAIIVSSLIFGLLHWTNENGTFFTGIAIAIEAGLLLGAAYKYSGSLWLPIGIHWAWNFTQGDVFGFAVSGSDGETSIITPQITGPEILTGGAFGAESSIISIVLGFAFSCWFIYKYQKRECCNCSIEEENEPISNELKNNILDK